MNKILTFCALYMAAGPLSLAQTTPLPYITGFENAPSLWQLIRKGHADPFYKWTISNINAYSGNSLYHGYPVGGTFATDDWYVSPPFSFAAGGKIDSLRHFFSGFGNPQAGDTVAIYLLNGNADPDLASKTLLYDFRDAKYVPDHTWNKTTNITIPPTSGSCYIAFRYRTVNNWLDVRFDNLGISGISTGVHHIYMVGKDFTTVPNPVINSITIHTRVAFRQVNIYNITGKTVYSHPFQSTIDLSHLPAGPYFLELADGNQQKGFLSIIKQ